MAKTKAQRYICRGIYIHIYPDLSWTTLQKRRPLKPPLLILKDQGIPYRWGFPFALSATKNGCTATLCAFEDLASFSLLLRGEAWKEERRRKKTL